MYLSAVCLSKQVPILVSAPFFFIVSAFDSTSTRLYTDLASVFLAAARCNLLSFKSNYATA